MRTPRPRPNPQSNPKPMPMAQPGRCALALLVIAFLPGCIPVFSEMQSARLTDPGRTQITPSYSAVTYVDENENERMAEHFGIQFAHRTDESSEARLRYDLIRDPLAEDEPVIHRVQFGPKESIVKDRVAIYIPLGMYLVDEINPLYTMTVHPTLLTTIAVSRYLEINPSMKAMVPICAPQATSFAFNLGLGISSDVRVWAWRPEVGIQILPRMAAGYFVHAGMGFTFPGT